MYSQRYKVNNIINNDMYIMRFHGAALKIIIIIYKSRQVIG